MSTMTERRKNMLFEAKCKRLVYRVTGTGEDGETCLLAFFHDPNAAHSHMVAQMLRPEVTGTKIEIVVMEFDGWKVVG